MSIGFNQFDFQQKVIDISNRIADIESGRDETDEGKSKISMLIETIFKEIDTFGNQTNDSVIKDRCKELKRELEGAAATTAPHAGIDIGKVVVTMKKISDELRATNLHVSHEAPLVYSQAIEGYRQIPVLSQINDDTAARYQNCGYHALKNALLLLLPVEYQNADIYTSKSLFKTLYDTYAVPLLEGRNSNQMDASVTLLREMIHNMVNDVNPPEVLRPLILHLSSLQNEFGIYNIASTGYGSVMFGSVDSTGVPDAIKLYEFAKKSPPASFVVVLGDPGTEHWCAVRADKVDVDKFIFTVCDSLDNNQIRAGSEASIYKIGELFVREAKNPNQLLETVLMDIGEILDRKIAQLAKDQDVSDEVHNKRMMDNFLSEVPNELLALKGIHDGSPRAVLLHQLFTALDVVKSGNLLNSREYDLNIVLKNMEELFEFYRSRISEGDNEYSKIVDALAYLKGRIKNSEIVALEDQIETLNTMMATQTDNISNLGVAKETLEFMKLLWNEARKVAQAGEGFDAITAEIERNNAANSLGSKCAVGVEAGFTQGETAEEAERNIRVKVQSTIRTFNKAKKMGKLNDLSKALLGGGSCMTNRVENIFKFAIKLDNIDLGDEGASSVQNFSQFTDYALSQVLDETYEELKSKNPEISDEREFIDGFDPEKCSEEVLEVFNRKFAEYLKAREKREPAPFVAFKKYLIKNSLIQDGTSAIDWEGVVQKFEKLEDFKGSLSKGKMILSLDL